MRRRPWGLIAVLLGIAAGLMLGTPDPRMILGGFLVSVAAGYCAFQADLWSKP